MEVVFVQCEMCGKEEQLFLTELEGTELQLCRGCARYGQIIRQPSPALRSSHSAAVRRTPMPEKVYLISHDAARLVKEKREQLGLKQEDLAKMLAERESLIHKLESGHISLSIALARKLERSLKIKLIEEATIESNEKTDQVKTGMHQLTIGDLMARRA